MLFREAPANCAQIVTRLLLVTGSDDHICDYGPLKQPVKSNVRNGLAGFFRNLLERVHNAVQKLIGYLRIKFRRLVETALFGKRLVAPNFSGETACCG